MLTIKIILHYSSGLRTHKSRLIHCSCERKLTFNFGPCLTATHHYRFDLISLTRQISSFKLSKMCVNTTAQHNKTRQRDDDVNGAKKGIMNDF